MNKGEQAGCALNPFGIRYPALDKAAGATDLACTQHIHPRPISAVAAPGNPVPGHSHSYGLPQLPHFYFVQSSSPSLAGGSRGDICELWTSQDRRTSRSAVRTRTSSNGVDTRRIGRHRAAILAALPACLPTPGSTVRRPSAIRRDRFSRSLLLLLRSSALTACCLLLLLPMY